MTMMDNGIQLTNGKMRKSSIELLKIVAMVFIIMSHSLPDGDVNTQNSAIDIAYGYDISMMILQIMHSVGQIGVNIFIICSCWFLVDDSNVNGEKIVRYFLDAWFVSIVSLIIFTLVGYSFPLGYVIKQFFPIVNGNSWFLSCYIILYAMHPLLNIIIDKLTQRQLCSISICLFIMYCCIWFVFHNQGFFYSKIIGFVVIYFIVAYIKKYLPVFIKKNALLLIVVSVIGITIVNLMSNYLAIQTGLRLYSHWITFINPLFLISAFGMFGFVFKKEFSNKFVNYISGISLLIYITHTNRIVRDYVRFDFFDFVLERYTYNNLLGWCFVYFFINLAYGLTFSFIYKIILDKFMIKISAVIYRFASAIWGKVLKVILRVSE